MNVEIILTGAELLLGETVDTNSVMMAKMFRQIGLDVYYKTTVGDNQAHITEVIKHALKRVDFIITSGGLGPTVDDVTREAVAAATNRPLIYSEMLAQQIADRFKKFGRDMPENNKRQAWIPEGAIPVENPVGSAPCFIVETERGAIISLPGVPRELKHQLEHAIIPYLKKRIGHPEFIKALTLRTCGVGESDLDQKIDDLMRLENPAVGLAAHLGKVDIRITAKAPTEAEADALIAPIEQEMRKRLGHLIFGINDETLPLVIAQRLQAQNFSLVLLDTFTGGGLYNAFAQEGLAHIIKTNHIFSSSEEALTHLDPASSPSLQNSQIIVEQFAKHLSQNNTLALAIIGHASNEEATILAITHQNEIKIQQHPPVYDTKTHKQRLIVYALSLIWQQLSK